MGVGFGGIFTIFYQRRKVDKLVELEGGWVDRREGGRGSEVELPQKIKQNQHMLCSFAHSRMGGVEMGKEAE